MNKELENELANHIRTILKPYFSEFNDTIKCLNKKISKLEEDKKIMSESRDFFINCLNKKGEMINNQYFTTPDLNKKISELEEKNKEQSKTIKYLTENVKVMSESRDFFSNCVKQKEELINHHYFTITDLNKKIKDLKEEIEELEKRNRNQSKIIKNYENKSEEIDTLRNSLKGKDELIKNWTESAAQYAVNLDYYTGLLDEIAKNFGIESYTSDDGSIQDTPLRAKIPELVKRCVDKKHEYAKLLDTLCNCYEEFCGEIEKKNNEKCCNEVEKKE